MTSIDGTNKIVIYERRSEVKNKKFKEESKCEISFPLNLRQRKHNVDIFVLHAIFVKLVINMETYFCVSYISHPFDFRQCDSYIIMSV